MPDTPYWEDCLLNLTREAMFRNKARDKSGRIYSLLGRFQLGVALDELLRATAGKAYRDTPVFLVAFDSHDRPDAVAWVANLTAKHGIGVGAAPHHGSARGISAA